MSVAQLASLEPVIHRAYAWTRKERFDRSEDRSVYWIAFAIQAGSFEYSIGESKATAAFGDVVICPPDVAFRRRILEPLTFQHVVFTWIDRDRREAVEPNSNDIRSFSITDVARLETTYAHMHRAIRMGDVHSNPWICHLFDDIWLMHCAESAQTELELWRHHSDRSMIQARQIIERQYAERLSINHLASLFDLSPSQFSRRYRNVFGETPIRHLTRFRLEEAKLLLLEGDATIEEIAIQCGFSNGFYLSRVFSQWIGESPSRYRASRRV